MSVAPEFDGDDDASEPYHGGRWRMYSAAGDDEVDQIMSASSTWEQLETNIAAATHREINDTAVRERVYEAFERRLQREADQGGAPFESYEEYCERGWPTQTAATASSSAAPATNPAKEEADDEEAEQ